MFDINLKEDRMELINIFYKGYIMNYNAEKIKQEILDNIQGTFSNPEIEKAALDIADKMYEYEDRIEDNMDTKWRWERLPNLVKAVLVIGAWEIENTTIEKPITIDTMVEIVKEEQPDWNHKFVNAILDKFVKL